MKLLVTGCHDYKIRLWSTDNWECFKIIEVHNDIVWRIRFSNDFQYIISAGFDSNVWIFDAKTGKEIM
jgi:WD40 repeat protein